jgi:hypothetical protein
LELKRYSEVRFRLFLLIIFSLDVNAHVSFFICLNIKETISILQCKSYTYLPLWSKFCYVFQVISHFLVYQILFVFSGYMLGVKSPSGLSFYDWESLELVRRIEIQPKAVYWFVPSSLKSFKYPAN